MMKKTLREAYEDARIALSLLPGDRTASTESTIIETESSKWPYLYGITNTDGGLRHRDARDLNLIALFNERLVKIERVEPDRDVRLMLLDRDGDPVAGRPLLDLGYCRFSILDHLSRTYNQMLLLEPREEGQAGAVVARLEFRVHVRPLDSDLDVAIGIDAFREFTKRLEQPQRSPG